MGPSCKGCAGVAGVGGALSSPLTPVHAGYSDTLACACHWPRVTHTLRSLPHQ